MTGKDIATAPAASVSDLFRTAQPEKPLYPGDPRYVAQIEGRSGTGSPLRRLEATLWQFIRDQDSGFAKLVFTGHRGAGKTTELLRLEDRLKNDAYVVHLEMDESLRADFDYTLMLLWLTEGLVEKLRKDGIALDKTLAKDVARWFAEVSQIEVSVDAVSAEASAEAGAGGGIGLLGIGLSFLAKLKGRMQSSREDRLEVRTRMQQRGTELIGKVNTLLLEAGRKLREAGRPGAIVIVQDNVDRLEREVAARLLIDNGELLKQLNVHLVLTAPLALTLAPDRIAAVFPQTFSLPTPKLRTRDGKRVPEAEQALRQVVLNRASEALFAEPTSIDRLVAASGGSFRDLIRLLRNVQVEAMADEAEQITGAHADAAIGAFRNSLVQALQPAGHYFPALVSVHRTKDAPLPDHLGENPDKARAFLREMIYIGAVLEYNGNDYWYDVHPALLTDRRFLEAEQRAR